MKIRHANLDDQIAISQIYSHAREEMKKNGNPHQWGNASPNFEDVIFDIVHNNFYIIEEKGRICGVFSLLFGIDPTYLKIEGQWLNNHPYATIHRIASDNSQKGVLEAAINYAFKFVSDVRIDTHKDNQIMRHLLKKLGFTYCGIIYLKNGDPRLAFHKCQAIYTDRLYLRKIVKNDADDIFNNWAKYDIVTKYMTWITHRDINDTKNILKIWINDYHYDDCYRFGIVSKETDELIGMIDVVNMENDVPEMGYVLSPFYWNNGYMTEACKAMISYLFDKDYNKIVIEAHVDNIGSNRVITKSGFKFTHVEERPMSIFKPEIVKVNCYEILKK